MSDEPSAADDLYDQMQPALVIQIGQTLIRNGKHAKAEQLFRRVLQRDKKALNAIIGLGDALRGQAKLAEASSAYKYALALHPDCVEALFGQAYLLQQQGDYHKACPLYRKAHELRPDSAWICYNLCIVLQKLAAYDEAILYAHKAIAIQPDFAEAQSSLAAALLRLHRTDEALEPCRRAIELDPNLPTAYTNLGTILSEQDKPDQALQAFHRAIELDENCAGAHFLLSLHLLAMGDYAQGWREYEWRLKDDEFPTCAMIAALEKPLWHGEDLQGKTLLIYQDQGIGDVIHFARFLPILATIAANVIVVVIESLVPLLKSSFPQCQIVSFADPLPDYDYHLPIMSLADRLGCESESSLSCHTPYLSVEKELFDHWQDYLRQKTKPKVGLAWSGNPKHFNDRNRSIPFTMIAPLFDNSRIDFYSLQNPVRPSEIDAVAVYRPKIRDLSSDLTDLAQAAAAIMAMDLVIAIDSAIAHLAGALGKLVWLLLPRPCDWRWRTEGEHIFWYPTMRLIRQKRKADWSDVIDLIGKDLASFHQMV